MEDDTSKPTRSASDSYPEVPYAEPAEEGAAKQENTARGCPGCGSRVPHESETCPGCGRTLYDRTEAEGTNRIGWPGIIGGLLVMVVLLVGFMLVFRGEETGWEKVSTSHRSAEGVTYRVVADGPVSVTYRDREEQIAQQVNVPTPWIYPDNSADDPFRPGPDQFVQIAAQKTEWKKEGRIKVQILVDGNVWKEDVCRGKYCIVSVDDVYRNAPR